MAFFRFSGSAGANRPRFDRSGLAGRAGRRRCNSTRRSLRPNIDALEQRALLSTVVTVTNRNDSGSGSLRAAINSATPGEVINFAKSAQGTITLSSGPLVVSAADLTISGPGSNKLTISGGGTFTDFILLGSEPPSSPAPALVVASGVNISGMTIANGSASNNGYGGGGGIVSFVDLSISSSVLKANQAPGGSGAGGAIYFAGGANASLTLNSDDFNGNSVGFASDTNPSDFETGGAIFNSGGVVTIASSTFENNTAHGANAQGGAIQAGANSTLTITGSTFTGNTAIGSINGAGGAIYGDPAQVTIDSSQFDNNKAESSSPSGRASGGAMVTNAIDLSDPNVMATTTITNSLFTDNSAVGAPGSGAAAAGGAIANEQDMLDVSGSTFVDNKAKAGSSASNMGGDASGGAIWAAFSTVTIQGGLISGNSAVGGRGGNDQGEPGGSGGSGAGGGIANMFASSLTITGTTIAGNTAEGAAGGKGNTRGTGGDGMGGGIEDDGLSTLSVTGSIVAGNIAEGGGGGGNADGGGIDTLGNAVITDTVVTFNRALGAKKGGEGFGGGIMIAGGTTDLVGTTDVVNNVASTSGNNVDNDSGPPIVA
jgi:fibronectin-binding autotransporter adhesin